ncbi:PI-PLC X domain-containing protein 1 [Fundulus heteroclitus]|uniref:PI-PLC X domain-containing protein 1 n=1 Tax=Fundulus heteroclitus TaxID=8078 RepID=UPI00165CC0E8|nr:PI-PLC X domain-containing protein 1 [Fundulus heteroclitus]XP_021172939.2 PI-PLC X domain-containing protein 1 [Fundulus heteroclitus]
MSYSDWMSQLPAELHTTPLFKLAIPGSHDSMSYDLDVHSRIIEPKRLIRFSRIYCLRKVVQIWAATQEVSITEQLNAGVRYFDLRIARKPNDTDPTRLYFHHGLYTRTDVETILREINVWAESHRKEVVILSLSHFEGFDKKIASPLHQHLINFIKEVFGAKLLLKTNTPTLKGCWNEGKNVIVSYDHPSYSHSFNFLWRKITYYYGNSMDRTQITAKLCQGLEKEKSAKYFFVCGLNPTLPHSPSILKYILRICDNFTNVARRGLPKMLRWVKQQYSKTPMNIVASDVVTRGNFVATIVKLNLEKRQ